MISAAKITSLEVYCALDDQRKPAFAATVSVRKLLEDKRDEFPSLEGITVRHVATYHYLEDIPAK